MPAYLSAQIIMCKKHEQGTYKSNLTCLRQFYKYIYIYIYITVIYITKHMNTKFSIMHQLQVIYVAQ